MYAWLFIVILASAALNLVFGRWEFQGFDLSPLIDSGWRVLIGQIPNQSFLCTFPPSTYLSVALAYKLFGVHWRSLFLAEDVLYVVLCVLGLRLCALLGSARGDRSWSLAAMYLAAQTMVLLSVNYTWHSTTASAFAAYSILATYTALAQLPGSRRIEVTAHLAFAASVLLLSKPNTAWPALLVCVLCLLLSRRSIVIGCTALGLAAVADLALLSAYRIRVVDILHGYAGVSARAIPRYFIVGIVPMRSRAGEVTVLLTYLLLLLPVVRLLQAAWEDRRLRRVSPPELLCFGACLVTVIGFGTNFDIKVVDVPPFLVGAALLATAKENGYQRLLRPLQWSAALLCVFAIVIGADRMRLKTTGQWAGSAYGKSVWLQDSFFGDLKTRDSFVELLREVDEVVAGSRGKRIFFGPRLEFQYAREGLASPLHLPVWWHPGTSYGMAQEGELEANWVRSNFDVLIFTRKDRAVFPPELLAWIDAHYALEDKRSSIDVYYRAAASGPTTRMANPFETGSASTHR